MRVSVRFGLVAAAAGLSLALVQATAEETALAEELERAKTLFVHGSFPEAAAALGSVVAKLELSRGGSEVRALLADAHFHLGLTYFALNASESARESFERVVRLDPDFPIDPERYAPRVVELFEEARRAAPVEMGRAERAAPSHSEDEGSGSDRVLVGAGGAAAGATVAALAAAGGDPAAPNDSPSRDVDGDGIAAGEGDCNDSDPRIHPDGEVSLRVSYAFTGTVACRTANPRQQIYEIVNHSCAPFSFLSLERKVATVDSLGRRTAGISVGLPLDVNFVAPGMVGVIRTGAPAGTVEALCRDLSLANPFSRPKGDLRVDETYVVRSAGGAELSATNSFLVLNTAECTFCSLDSIFGPYAARSSAFRWTSELNATGGSGRLLLDGNRVLNVGPGIVPLSAELGSGEVLVEAQLVAGDGRAGTWRFDFGQSPGFEPGSLTVREGEIAVLTEMAVSFRLLGEPGERLAFTFRVRP